MNKSQGRKMKHWLAVQSNSAALKAGLLDCSKDHRDDLAENVLKRIGVQYTEGPLRTEKTPV